MMKQVKVKIYGRVQGVFYRACTQEKAAALGVVGWVRNCDDGTVEALFQAEPERLKEMITWCHQGSPDAGVDQAAAATEVVLAAYRSAAVGEPVQPG